MIRLLRHDQNISSGTEQWIKKILLKNSTWRKEVPWCFAMVTQGLDFYSGKKRRRQEKHAWILTLPDIFRISEQSRDNQEIMLLILTSSFRIEALFFLGINVASFVLLLYQMWRSIVLFRQSSNQRQSIVWIASGRVTLVRSCAHSFSPGFSGRKKPQKRKTSCVLQYIESDEGWKWYGRHSMRRNKAKDCSIQKYLENSSEYNILVQFETRSRERNPVLPHTASGMHEDEGWAAPKGTLDS